MGWQRTCDFTAVAGVHGRRQYLTIGWTVCSSATEHINKFEKPKKTRLYQVFPNFKSRDGLHALVTALSKLLFEEGVPSQSWLITHVSKIRLQNIRYHTLWVYFILCIKRIYFSFILCNITQTDQLRRNEKYQMVTLTFFSYFNFISLKMYSYNQSNSAWSRLHCVCRVRVSVVHGEFMIDSAKLK